MIKDVLDTLKACFGLVEGITSMVGWATIALIVLSRWPEYNFITKYIVTLVLTH